MLWQILFEGSVVSEGTIILLIVIAKTTFCSGIPTLFISSEKSHSNCGSDGEGQTPDGGWVQASRRGGAGPIAWTVAPTRSAGWRILGGPPKTLKKVKKQFSYWTLTSYNKKEGASPRNRPLSNLNNSCALYY